MKTHRIHVWMVMGSLLFVASAWALPMGTAFNYQGFLEKPAGTPLTDTCDFRFYLIDAPSGANIVGDSPQIATGVSVASGNFSVEIDFGASAFTGEGRWMTIEVRCTGDGAYVPMTPAVELAPAPYALALPGLRTPETATVPNVIGGGLENTMSAGVEGGTIAGGGIISPNSESNVVVGDGGTVGGGTGNGADMFATVAGGYNNGAAGQSSAIGGGEANFAGGARATVGGGIFNWAGGELSTVGGGNENLAIGQNSTIGGGSGNGASGESSTVSGGGDNSASGMFSTVAGGTGNSSFGARATVSGGDGNGATSLGATVAGGLINLAGDEYSTVSGGQHNQANAYGSTVIGGEFCVAGGEYAVAGGFSNGAIAGRSTVLGGWSNTASGLASIIGGGSSNNAQGSFSAVIGGFQNAAGGDFSFAAGTNAKVRTAAESGDSNGDEGSFVWADNTASSFTSTGPNQFLVRASGNVGIGTNSPGMSLEVASPSYYGQPTMGVAEGTSAWVYLLADAFHHSLIWNSSNDMRFGSEPSRGIGYTERMRITGSGNVGIGTNNPTSKMEIAAQDGLAINGFQPFLTLRDTNAANARTRVANANGDFNFFPESYIGGSAPLVLTNTTGRVGIGDTTPEVALDVVGDIHYTGVITDVSDERLKEEIRPVESALDKVSRLRGVTFAMKGSSAAREAGLIAQDVEAVLPEAVRVVDPETGYLGVSYPSVTSLLVESIKEMRTELDATRTDKAVATLIQAALAQLEQRNAELEARLARLEALLQNTRAASTGDRK